MIIKALENKARGKKDSQLPRNESRDGIIRTEAFTFYFVYALPYV